MGFPLSPVIVEVFMEAFEQRSLVQAFLKLLVYRRYMDDTFLVCQHGHDALESFVYDLNAIYETIKFTVEKEREGKLPFLDILIIRHEDGTLGRETLTGLYLNNCSCHHPVQKRGVLMTLLEQAHRMLIMTIWQRNDNIFGRCSSRMDTRLLRSNRHL